MTTPLRSLKDGRLHFDAVNEVSVKFLWRPTVPHANEGALRIVLAREPVGVEWDFGNDGGAFGFHQIKCNHTILCRTLKND